MFTTEIGRCKATCLECWRKRIDAYAYEGVCGELRVRQSMTRSDATHTRKIITYTHGHRRASTKQRPCLLPSVAGVCRTPGWPSPLRVAERQYGHVFRTSGSWRTIGTALRRVKWTSKDRRVPLRRCAPVLRPLLGRVTIGERACPRVRTTTPTRFAKTNTPTVPRFVVRFD